LRRLSVPCRPPPGPRSIASLIEEAYQKESKCALSTSKRSQRLEETDVSPALGPNPDLSGQIGGKIYNSLGGKYLGTGPRLVSVADPDVRISRPGKLFARRIADKQIAPRSDWARAISAILFVIGSRCFCYRLLAAQEPGSRRYKGFAQTVSRPDRPTGPA